jgi:hypothetical protein
MKTCGTFATSRQNLFGVPILFLSSIQVPAPEEWRNQEVATMHQMLEEIHKVLLGLTLILLHIITYGFIIWSVLCQHGVIDCGERAPAACACHAIEKQVPSRGKKPQSGKKPFVSEPLAAQRPGAHATRHP